MYPLKILADKVLNLTDARYFAARGVDFICLNDENQPEVNSGAEMAAIAGWIDGPAVLIHFISDAYQSQMEGNLDIAGFIFDNNSQKFEVNSSESDYKILIFDVHDFDELVQKGLSGTDIVLRYDYIILRLRNTQKDLDSLIREGALPILQSICAAASVFIDVKLSPDSLGILLEEIRPEGIVVYGGQEDQIGVKDYDQLDEIFDVLEALEM